MLNYEDILNTITEYKLASLMESSASLVYKFLYQRRISERVEIMKNVIACLNFWGKQMNCSYEISRFLYSDFCKNMSVINKQTSKRLMEFRVSERPQNAKQGMDNLLLACESLKGNVGNINENAHTYLAIAFEHIFNHYGASKEELAEVIACITSL